MGNTWCVEVWGQFEVGRERIWNRIYGGESMLPALWAFLKWRRKWHGSVRLSYFKQPPTTGEKA